MGFFRRPSSGLLKTMPFFDGLLMEIDEGKSGYKNRNDQRGCGRGRGEDGRPDTKTEGLTKRTKTMDSQVEGNKNKCKKPFAPKCYGF
jgi:hypothetical protein